MNSILCLIKHILDKPKPKMGKRITNLTQLKPGDKIYVKKAGVFQGATVDKIAIYEGREVFSFPVIGYQSVSNYCLSGNSREVHRTEIYKYE